MQDFRCRLCLGADVFDTGLRALYHEQGTLFRVFECRDCTGRFIAEIPPVIEKVQADGTEVFDSPERRAAQRAHFAAKRAADEHDYPYSLIPLVQRYANGTRVLDLGCGASQFLPLIQRIEHRFGDHGGKRPDQFVDAKLPDVVIRLKIRRTGRDRVRGKLRLGDPDRVLIAHPRRHQPRDFAEHAGIDIGAADEPAQTIDIKLGVAWPLILDQKPDPIADERAQHLRANSPATTAAARRHPR